MKRGTGKPIPGLRRLFRLSAFRPDPSGDLDAELAFHFRETEEELLAHGLSLTEAREEAHRRFGDLARYRKELMRIDRGSAARTRRGAFFDAVVQDLSYVVRGLRRGPGFTAAVVLTLALGIGANTAIFSIVQAVVLEPLPFPEPARLVTVWEDHEARGGPRSEWTGSANFVDWREQNRVFENLAAYTGWGPSLTGDGEPESLTGERVSHELFSVLGVQPAAGRGFVAADEVPGGETPAIVFSRPDQGQMTLYQDLSVRRAVTSSMADWVTAELQLAPGLRAANKRNETARLEAVRALPRPITLDVTHAGRRARVPNGFDHVVPATMVWFILQSILTIGGATLLAERQSGILARLAASQIDRRTILWGHWASSVGLAALQDLGVVATIALRKSMNGYEHEQAKGNRGLPPKYQWHALPHFFSRQ